MKCVKCSRILEGIKVNWKIGVICDVLRNLVPLYNLKNVKNIHGGVLLLVKLQASFLPYSGAEDEYFLIFLINAMVSYVSSVHIYFTECYFF